MLLPTSFPRWLNTRDYGCWWTGGLLSFSAQWRYRSHSVYIGISSSSQNHLDSVSTSYITIRSRLRTMLMTALVSMCIIVATVVLRGVAVEPELRGPPLHAVSLIRSGVFEAIGVISFAVSPVPSILYLPSLSLDFSSGNMPDP